MEIVLKYKNTLDKSFKQTKQDREFFIRQLRQVKCVSEAYKSGGNFVLAKFNVDADKVADYLLKEYAIFVKIISSKFNSGDYIRFAVRLPEENDVLINALLSYC